MFFLGLVIGLVVGGTIVYLYYSTIDAKYEAVQAKLKQYENSAKAVVNKL